MVKMRKVREEFLKFLESYGVLGVAVGIVMGQAVAKVITAIVEGLVMPVIAVILPGNTWQEAVIHIGKVTIKLGVIIAALIDFCAISIVVFFVVRFLLHIKTLKEK